MFLVPVSRQSHSVARLFDDAVFDRFFGPSTGAARAPALDVAETDAGYTATLDVPGVAKEDVQVSIDGKRVTVQAQSKSDAAAKDGDRIVWRERAATKFARSFTLAAEVDQAASSAKLEHGVLVLTLAKRAPKTAAQLAIN